MIWRSLRLPPLSSLPRHAATNLSTTVQLRNLSALRSSSPSIAAILAIPQTADPHTVTAIGSVRTIRKQKHRSFVKLGDGSTTYSLQAVLQPSQAEGLSTGTSVEITGTWEPSPLGKEQSHELKAEHVKVVGATDAEKYPIQKKYHTAEYLRSLPHLRLRTPLNALLARMRSECDFSLASFFRKEEFVRLQPPIITSSDCEGAGEVFTVSNEFTQHVNEDPEASGGLKQSFFEDPKFLTVSSQLHLEAFVHEHRKVWAFSPTFRAERSDTTRHVSEFWMLEAEIRTESLEEVMDLVEVMITTLTTQLNEAGILKELIHAHQDTAPIKGENARFPEILEQRWQGLLKSPWPRVTYQEAMQLLQTAVTSKGAVFQYKPAWSTGLQLEHERFIVETIGKGSPVFVTHYPREIKPFYMLPTFGDSSTGVDAVSCFDLLLPEVCEVVGGSLREHRLESLIESMPAQGLNTEQHRDLAAAEASVNFSPAAERGNLDWYVDLRRYGSVPHGGFGLGFDRLLGYLAGINNIKDVVPWPRYYGKCDC